MLDIKLIRNQPEMVRTAIKNKNETGDIDRILELDESRRTLTSEDDTLRHQRKTESQKIGALMKDGKNDEADEIKKLVAGLKDRMKKVGEELGLIDAELNAAMLAIPNIPLESVPIGKTEEDNVLVREKTAEACFTFEAKPHWELGDALGIFNFPGGSKITGSGFPIFKGTGARLVRALINFMLDLHTTEHGYTEVWVPPISNRASMTGTGQLPKFESDMYRLEADDLFLIPTAEVPLTNMLRGDNIDHRDLPQKYCAFSQCFRREAGAAGKDTRGLIRVHWFDKVELVAFTKPEDSAAMHEEMLLHAEEIPKRLDLPYRVQLMCTGEMTFANARQYDIELWCPGIGNFQEVSSISTFTDFQARRMNTRFRDESGKLKFLHTLNASGVAFARLIIAIMENYQQADGSIRIPDALQPYMGGLELITPLE